MINANIKKPQLLGVSHILANHQTMTTRGPSHQVSTLLNHTYLYHSKSAKSNTNKHVGVYVKIWQIQHWIWDRTPRGGGESHTKGTGGEGRQF